VNWATKYINNDSDGHKNKVIAHEFVSKLWILIVNMVWMWPIIKLIMYAIVQKQCMSTLLLLFLSPRLLSPRRRRRGGHCLPLVSNWLKSSCALSRCSFFVGARGAAFFPTTSHFTIVVGRLIVRLIRRSHPFFLRWWNSPLRRHRQRRRRRRGRRWI